VFIHEKSVLSSIRWFHILSIANPLVINRFDHRSRVWPLPVLFFIRPLLQAMKISFRPRLHPFRALCWMRFCALPLVPHPHFRFHQNHFRRCSLSLSRMLYPMNCFPFVIDAKLQERRNFWKHCLITSLARTHRSCRTLDRPSQHSSDLSTPSLMASPGARVTDAKGSVVVRPRRGGLRTGDSSGKGSNETGKYRLCCPAGT
jgi:hypothetical protein